MLADLMLKLPTPYALRPAHPGELPCAVAIDDAGAEQFEAIGIRFDLSDEHPFVQAERLRWQHALKMGELFFACHADEPVGFFALSTVAGHAYLEQLSVRPDHGRRGLGTALLQAACARCAAHGDIQLWLTTYAHVPWNAPFYERCGFRIVPEVECDPQLRALLDEQRSALPAPEQRVAMVRPLRA